MSQELKRTSTLVMESECKQKWGVLTNLCKGVSSYDLVLGVISIGRNPENDIIINDKRLSGKHCQLMKDENIIKIVDLSTNGTFIKNEKIGKGNQKQLKNQDQIWLLPPTRVSTSQTLGFKLQLFQKKEESLHQNTGKKQSQEYIQQKEQQQKKQQQRKQQQKKQQKKKDQSLTQSLKEQITCSFCFQIMCVPVSVQPCNHRFCGGCLSQLIKNKKGQCIQCRKEITTGARDAVFFSIIEDYLKNHPQDKRADEEQSKQANIFGHDPIDIYSIIHGKKKKAERAPRGRGRRAPVVGSDLSASDGQGDRCRECVTARDGFQCDGDQVHVGCFSCGKLIARRDSPALHQSCALCSNYFCNLYYPPCVRRAGVVQLTLVKDKRAECKIDTDVLRSNKYQFQALRNYLLSKKMDSKDLFTYMLDNHLSKDKFSYIIDRKVMRNAPTVARQVKIDPNSAVCDTCWGDLWFQIIFAFRRQIYGQLPPSVKDRPDCYWGINCTTMAHKFDHAQKYNHMIFQSKF